MVSRTPTNQPAGHPVTQQVSRVGVTVQTRAARAHGKARLRDRDTDAGIEFFQPQFDLVAAKGIQELDAVAVDKVVIGFPILGTLDHLELGELEQVSRRETGTQSAGHVPSCRSWKASAPGQGSLAAP